MTPKQASTRLSERLQELTLSDENTVGLREVSFGDSKVGNAKTPGKTPGRKVRKFTARKWDLGDENEIDCGY